jgi:hypothetical protein
LTSAFRVNISAAFPSFAADRYDDGGLSGASLDRAGLLATGS